MSSDARALQAREHHRAAMACESEARQHREARDHLVRKLRAEDPVLWTYSAIAGAVNCSPELVASIIKGRR